MISTVEGTLSVCGIYSHNSRITADIEADYFYEPRVGIHAQGLIGKYPRRLLDKVRINFQLIIPPGKRECAERILKEVDQGCAVYRTFQRGIDMNYTWEIEEKKI